MKVSLCALVIGAVWLSLGSTACELEDMPDAPQAAGSQAATASCKDSLGSTFAITPATSTVAPGATIAMAIQRNGGVYTPGFGSPTVHYAAPDGGTLADADAIQTDYTAGMTPGDYRVTAHIAEAASAPNAGATVCDLTAIVHVVVGQGGSDGGAEAGYGMGDRPVQKVSLAGAWTFVEDANQNDPAPSMTLVASSADSVTVSYDGADGQKCDCNAEHLVIPLGKTYDPTQTSIEFDYVSGGSFGPTSNEALSIRFCKDGQCSPDAGFYGGDQIAVSSQTGHSNCAWEYGNAFPEAPQLQPGHNRVDLSKLTRGLNGSVSAPFDTIDIHMQAYACFKGEDTGTATLSNVVLY